jgi:hypothetical protein
VLASRNRQRLSMRKKNTQHISSVKKNAAWLDSEWEGVWMPLSSLGQLSETC